MFRFVSSALLPLIGLLAIPAASFAAAPVGNGDEGCTALTKVYTLDADFNLGTLNGVITNSDQLELAPTATTWPYAWIANASEGTVSKVDTQTGNEVGRYYTGPPDINGFHWYLSPSRTVIDKDGNCWVANRTASADSPSVTQIVITGGDDRNLNSIIDTSTDANSNGVIDPGELLPWGQDERVKRHYLVGNQGNNPARGMVIDKMGFLWVGLSQTTELVKVDPNLPISTYAPNMPPSQAPALATIVTGHLPYGLALAPSGLIYMSERGPQAFEIDPGIASGGTGAGPAVVDSINHSPYFNYGIAVDKDCNVWLASCTHPLSIRWVPATNNYTVSGPGAPGPGRGITVDFNNNVWMSCMDNNSSVVRYNNIPSPTVFGFWPTAAPGPIGVGVASDGNIIVTGGTSPWCKVNSSTGAAMPLPGPELAGPGPYTYSDFTGSLFSLSALQQGTWNVITDGGSPSFVWNFVGWTPTTPPGTSIQIDARVAQTLPLLSSTSWTTIGTPGPQSPMPGRYIETRAILQRTNEGCSPPFVTPILHDLTVAGICDTCEFANCPADTTIPCATAQGSIFEYLPPLLEESCQDETYQFSCSPPSGSVFPIGTTPVTCIAVNASDDTVKCLFSVTVLPGCDPTPTGACCLSNNCQVLTEHDCQLQGGIYFGNGSNCTVGCNYACVPPPHHLVGWWKLDGSTSGRTPNLANPAVPGTLAGNPTLLPGENVNGAYSFNGTSQYIEVPPSPTLTLGTGDFSIDAWVKTTAAVGVVPIVDKRGGAATQGYGLFLNDGYPALQLAVGGASVNYTASDQPGSPSAFVADDHWHLVAVSVDRDSPDGIQFYVDGNPVGTPFDPTAQNGSLENEAPLWIARSHPIPTSRYFAGSLDEIEIIQDVVSHEKVLSIFQAGAAGKCPELCYATQNVPCCFGFGTGSSVTICNYDVVSHVYSYGLSPLNGGPGCGPVGPISFLPNSGTVTVGPGSCVTVPITIGCPSNIPPGQVACYQVSLFNHDTGRLFACKGSVKKPIKWCAKWEMGPVDPVGVVTMAEGQSTKFDLRIGNIADESAPSTLNYTLRPLAGGCCEPDQPGTALRLNGLPPGEPVIGTLMVSPDETGNVSVDVEYPTAWLIGYERLALFGDDDGDGVDEMLGEIALRSVPTSLVSAPGGPPPVVDAALETGRLFVTVPNPFGGSGAITFRLPGSEPAEVKLRLFDLSGRMMKVFYMERLLEPGEHSVPWSAVDDRGAKLGTGMYFLKLEIGERAETVKVVVRR